MAHESARAVKSPVKWPVEPWDDVVVSKDRIWIDGCFDFSHHGISQLHTSQPNDG